MSESRCPFCGTELRDAPAPLGIVGLVLGLALVGCSKGECPDGATTTSSSSSAMDDAVCGQASTYDTEDSNAADYGGAEWEESLEDPDPTDDPDPTNDETTDDGSTTSVDTTGAESSSSDTTGGTTGDASSSDTTAATDDTSGTDSGESTSTTG